MTPFRSTLMTAVAPAACLAAVGLVSTQAQAATVDVDSLRIVNDVDTRDESGTPPFAPYANDGLGNSNINAINFGGIGIGQRQSSDTLTISKVGLYFELPTIPAGQLVQSATLRVSYRNENVFSSGYPGVSVFHSATANQAAVEAASLFEDASFVDTGSDIFTEGDPFSTTAVPYYTLDVTAEVLADYAGDTGTVASAFRLEAFDGIFGNALEPVENRYFIRSSANSGAGGSETFTAIPQLEIVFAPIPEPASLSLLGLGTLLIAGRRRRA